MRLLFALVLVVGLIAGLVLQRPNPPMAEPDGVDLFYDTNPQMNAAIDEAQSTLPLFLEAVMAGDRMDPAAALKVAFQTFPEDMGLEVIWVANIRSLPDGTYQGHLNNAPVFLGDWEPNEPVTFPASAIRDWSLDSADGLYGNYTTRVIAAQPGNEHLGDFLAPTPVPAHWQ